MSQRSFSFCSLYSCVCVTDSDFSFLRGHTVKAVCESFHLAKDSGFKVVAHMMPDLPNVGLERDIEQFTVSVLNSWSVPLHAASALSALFDYLLLVFSTVLKQYILIITE